MSDSESWLHVCGVAWHSSLGACLFAAGVFVRRKGESSLAWRKPKIKMLFANDQAFNYSGKAKVLTFMQCEARLRTIHACYWTGSMSLTR